MTAKDCQGRFTVQCQGRDETGATVLNEPVTIQVRISKNPDSNDLSSRVKCKYLSGGHDDRCEAINNLGPGIVREYADCSPVGAGYCAYSFEIPGMIDNLRRDRK